MIRFFNDFFRALAASCRKHSAGVLLVPGLMLGSGVALAGAHGEAGWYIDGGGAWSSVEDANINVPASSGGAGADCALELPLLGCLIPGGGGGGGGALTGDAIFDDGTDFHLAVGRQFRNGLRADLSLDWLTNDVDAIRAEDGSSQNSDAELEAIGLLANLWYDFKLPYKLMPYVGGGLGARDIELSGGDGSSADDTVMGYQLGAGLGWALSERIAVSLDYRYLNGEDPEYELAGGGRLKSEFEAQTVGLSARYLFIHLPPPDTDGDGVPDRADDCPGTPAGVAVDDTGCALDSDGDGVNDSSDSCPNTPSGTPVDSKGCPRDSDKDGVTDNEDQCPNTPAGTTVDSKGCALDSDGDGVVNASDECPNTPTGNKVMSNGCESLVLEGVQFETDSAELLSEAQGILDEAAATLKRRQGFDVEVQGHTDALGGHAYNQRLSQRRAEAVRSYLIDQGVSAERLSARGYGEAQPIDSNETESGRTNNRRVELTIISN